MKIRSQVGMVLNLDKCIGCHTCSVTCKNVWTSREGMEYAWFNNVESKPGVGYPRAWEDQEKWKGGWIRKINGQLQPRMGSRAGLLSKIFANPDVPALDDYYEPFDFDYQHLHNAPEGKHQPIARPRSLITGQRMKKIENGPNWEEILGGEFAKRSQDKNFDNIQKEMYGQFENTFMMYLPRLCEHCLNPACVATCPSGAIYKRGEDGIVLDHTDWLGPDRESIGREKAGVFRSAKPAVVGEPEMPQSIAAVAQETGAQLLQLGRDWHWQPQEQGWRFSFGETTLQNLPLPQVPLPNAATALAALSASGLQVSEAVIRQHLDKALLPGRFQTVAQRPRVILDVAHNPHAAGYLAGRLAQLPKTGQVRAVVGMLHDKDIAGTLACLAPQIDSWHLAPLEGPRGASAAELMSALNSDRACAFASVAEAWQAAMHQADEQDIVLVCGSFHTVAQVMEAMETEKDSGK